MTASDIKRKVKTLVRLWNALPNHLKEFLIDDNELGAQKDIAKLFKVINEISKEIK